MDPVRRTVRLPLPVDLPLTLWPLRRGFGDPTMLRDGAGSWWRATRTCEGPATARYTQAADAVEVQAWGPGAAWALEHAAALLGSGDRLDGFDPASGLLRELHRRMPGLRITRTEAVFEAIVPSVLEQKVPGASARAAFRSLVRRYGEPAPGPGGLLLPPAPERLAATPSFDFHPLGIEARRAGVLREIARRAPRVEATRAMPLPGAYRRLQAFPGVGPWTAAEVAIVALGDADAVSLGDYHLPHMVAWALAGQARGNDDLMLELLEPYRGHRGRVLRLLGAAGISPLRRGPRLPLARFASI
jgi:3-methyladenine DNA glycosylase/8-oxoguanine DNA glycosylase